MMYKIDKSLGVYRVQNTSEPLFLMKLPTNLHPSSIELFECKSDYFMRKNKDIDKHAVQIGRHAILLCSCLTPFNFLIILK